MKNIPGFQDKVRELGTIIFPRTNVEVCNLTACVTVVRVKGACVVTPVPCIVDETHRHDTAVRANPVTNFVHDNAKPQCSIITDRRAGSSRRCMSPQGQKAAERMLSREAQQTLVRLTRTNREVRAMSEPTLSIYIQSSKWCKSLMLAAPGHQYEYSTRCARAQEECGKERGQRKDGSEGHFWGRSCTAAWLP